LLIKILIIDIVFKTITEIYYLYNQYQFYE